MQQDLITSAKKPTVLDLVELLQKINYSTSSTLIYKEIFVLNHLTLVNTMVTRKTSMY